ncbi:MAG TPA: 3-hydroxy-3-methylglutaryl-CoA reductase, partial [Patescibacteria group bacterium]|nr:3-hydroxy-3-methylglutaryl-CoA reductase [Patescibacteria group bacterium]
MTAVKTTFQKIPTNPEAIQERRELLQKREERDFPLLFQQRFDPTIVGSHNCENLIGSVELPLGIAGPITIKHQSLQHPVYVPLATTEGALVASVNRGMKALEESGGVQVTVKYSGMSRAPVFLCKDGATAAEFDLWLHDTQQKLWEKAQETSKHLKMLEMRTWIVGRHLYARFTADTDQAMGMNMITVA